MYLRALKVRSPEAAVTGSHQKMRSRMTILKCGCETFDPSEGQIFSGSRGGTETRVPL